MARLILNTVNAFDCSIGQNFIYRYTGNETEYYTVLTIYNLSQSDTIEISTNSEINYVYDESSNSSQTIHELSASNNLSNGNDYYAQLSLYYNSGQDVIQSNMIKIKCFTSPTVVCNNANNAIQISNYNFEFTYSQPQSELLYCYSVSLLENNTSRNSVYNSTLLYCHETSIPTTIEHTIRNLSNGNYILKFTGQTINGLSIVFETAITVNYSSSNSTGVISATNDSAKCRISVSVDYSSQISSLSNVKSIRVKRKIAGQYDSAFMVIYEKNISSADDSVFVIYDNFAKAKTNYVYAACIVFTNENESGLIRTGSVLSKFYGVAICDMSTIYSTELETEFDFVKNHKSNLITTLNDKYPYVVKTDNTDYWSGSISAFWIGINNCDFDFENAVSYRENFMNWLNNSQSKILKFDDGRAYLIYVSSGSTRKSDSHPDKEIISFEWTEIGDCGSKEDLYRNGLLMYNSN